MIPHRPGLQLHVLPASAEPRRFNRTAVAISIRLRSASGLVQDAVIRDLSRGGCKAELRHELVPGTACTIIVPLCRPIRAQVQWTGTVPMSAGFAFDEQISLQVFDALVSRSNLPWQA